MSWCACLIDNKLMYWEKKVSEFRKVLILGLSQLDVDKEISDKT